jgi:hypothetical protein
MLYKNYTIVFIFKRTFQWYNFYVKYLIFSWLKLMIKVCLKIHNYPITRYGGSTLNSDFVIQIIVCIYWSIGGDTLFEISPNFIGITTFIPWTCVRCAMKHFCENFGASCGGRQWWRISWVLSYIAEVARWWSMVAAAEFGLPRSGCCCSARRRWKARVAITERWPRRDVLNRSCIDGDPLRDDAQFRLGVVSSGGVMLRWHRSWRHGMVAGYCLWWWGSG